MHVCVALVGWFSALPGIGSVSKGAPAVLPCFTSDVASAANMLMIVDGLIAPGEEDRPLDEWSTRSAVPRVARHRHVGVSVADGEESRLEAFRG